MEREQDLYLVMVFWVV